MRVSAYLRLFRLASLLLIASVAAHQPAFAEDAPIRIGYPSGLNAQIPIVMEKAGLAAKHQLNATFTGFQNGPPMMEALVAGQLDAVITSPLPPIVLASKLPGSIAIVAALGNSSHSLLVPKDSTAAKLTDLKGKKIGVSFTTDSHLDLVITLKQEGLDPKDDVQLVNLAPNELPAALDKGLVDAALVRQPQVMRLIEGSGARSIQTWPFHFLSIVRTEYLKANPDAVKRYLEALRESVFYIITNPDEASRWFGEVQRVDPAIVRRVFNENPIYSYTKLDEISTELTKSFRDYLSERLDASHSYGFVRNKVALDSLVP
jgi:ABC-type nitrate/sulfonate/bicarbonate transport system substrate-binding protein